MQADPTNPSNTDLFHKIRHYWFEARAAHAENRLEQAIDEDFYNHIQWSDEDSRILLERKQKPIVFNEIAPAVEWIAGTEKRAKIEWSVLPVGDEDRESAEIKTKLLKYVADCNDIEYQRSRAFKDSIIVGVGWMEYGVRHDAENEPLFGRHESWRNLWLDPLSTELDISDARYLLRSKVVDYDVALAMFPEHEATLRVAHEQAFHEYGMLYDEDLHDTRQHIDTSMANLAGLSNGDVTPGCRKVVRLIECWHKVPVNARIVRGGSRFDGLKYDETNVDMLEEIQEGEAKVYQSFSWAVRCTVICSHGVLQDIESPYRHNKFPFVPTWCFRRGRDNMVYGVVRGTRDSQEYVNKLHSKALFMLSVNRTIMDEGAVVNMDHFEQEVARPDAIIVKRPGKELKIETNVQIAEEHLMMAGKASEYIRHVSGVTGENQGHETNAVSGKAIQARQLQGTVITAGLFDNNRLSLQQGGRLMLSCVEQFYDMTKVIRIVGERGAQEFITINEVMPDGTINNPITLSRADFKVTAQDYQESTRLAQFDVIQRLVATLPPEVQLNVLDVVLESSDVIGKDELVRRIRQMNGYSDPNDPHAAELEEQAQVMKQQQQQEAAELEKQRISAEIRVKNAQAEAQEANSQSTKIQSMIASLQAAIELLSTDPTAASTADMILKGADDVKPGAMKNDTTPVPA